MCLLVSCSLFYYIVFYLILFQSIPGGGTTRTMAQAAGATPLSIATEPAFQTALQAATGNETDIAKLHTKHISDFGGYYLADVSFQIHTHIYTNTHKHIHNADSEHMLSIANSMELADSGKVLVRMGHTISSFASSTLVISFK